MSSSSFTKGGIRKKPSPSISQCVCMPEKVFIVSFMTISSSFFFSLVWCWTFWFDLIYFLLFPVSLCFVFWGFLNFILQSFYWFVYDATIFLILRVFLIPWLFLFIASSVCFIDAVFFIALKILNIDFCFLLHCLCFFYGSFCSVSFTLLLDKILKYIAMLIPSCWRPAISELLIGYLVFMMKMHLPVKLRYTWIRFVSNGLNWMMFRFEVNKARCVNNHWYSEISTLEVLYFFRIL